MKKLLLAAAAALLTLPVSALTIFPIDKAQILAGAQFDFKVELDSVVDTSAVTVTINGA